MRIATPEQSSKTLQQAQQQLVEVEKQHSESLKTIRNLRETYRQTNNGMVDGDSEAGRRVRARLAELRATIDPALKTRDAAREAMTTAKDRAAAAEREACKAVGDKHRDDYLKRFRAYVTAKLESIEPQAVAATEAIEIRDAVRVALGPRREQFARLHAGFGLVQDAERFDNMKREIVELVEAGTISKKDVPPKLAKIWNL